MPPSLPRADERGVQRLVSALFQRVCYCDDAVLPLDSRLAFFLECRCANMRVLLLLKRVQADGMPPLFPPAWQSSPAAPRPPRRAAPAAPRCGHRVR